ncbi:hypothetical protein OGAPHI_000260 [Ogataea philodendri]|uniref:Copper-fist domain-containing protein n=1 Tax=Ogataea philodendri TaxID=1378263 RepID=A0A9P8PGR9_9ASCO|nr:uncharacterized protein OGAPHI_000260 [Ogataea philodendri]KAH3671557.1 hypothetical protein OGAPHI_000260 [Ogataea philodendri]
MILVDGDKYACEQCIRGHRSSQCQHIKRPLVLVRSRGRPATDSSKRIAIVGEELEPAEEHNCSDQNCHCQLTKVSDKSVIVLKANKRQVFNVAKRSLKLLDPVIEIPNKQAGLDLITNRTHGKSSCKPKRAKIEHPQPPMTYDMFVTDSCTVPGSCSCDPDMCNCEFCQVHNTKTAETYAPLSYGKVNVEEYSLSGTPTDDGECFCAADDCGCYNCEKHGRVNGQTVGLQEAALNFLNGLDISELDFDCCCPDDSCNCTNCFKHGRFQNESLS